MMNQIERLFSLVDRITATWLLPTSARFVFAATLAAYYGQSALTKIDVSSFSFSVGAYAQIFPKTMESVGYNPAELSIFHTLVVMAATFGELILPFLIIVGFLSRLAALGMIGFIFVQSVVDIYGHNLAAKDIGHWFDGIPNSLILDQRAFWVFLLVVIALKGAGPLSIDYLLIRKSSST